VRDDVAIVDVVGEDDGYRDGATKGMAMLIAHDGESAWIMAASGCHFGNGRGEDVGAVEVEKL